MHKCETCQYKGEFYDVKFRPQHVCHKARNQVEAVLAYRAEECPFKNMEGLRNEEVGRDQEGAGVLYEP